MLDTLKDFWHSVPKLGRLFIGLIFFAVVGATLGSYLIWFVSDDTASLVGLLLGLAGYAVLASKRGFPL